MSTTSEGHRPRAGERARAARGVVAAMVTLALGVAAPLPLAAGAPATFLRVTGVGDWPTFHSTGDRAGVNAEETTIGPGNASKLTRAWSYATGGEVSSSPVVAGGVVYVGSADKKLYALDAATGARIWSYATAGAVYSSPAVSGGVVYVGSDDKKIYAINTADGTLRWSYLTGGKLATAAALVADGLVVMGSRDGNVYALDQDTGTLEWSYNTWAVWGAAAISGSTVYVGSDQSKVFALDAATGDLIWSAGTGGRVRSGVTVSGTSVFVGADDDRVYAFDAATGALRWKTAVLPAAGIVRSTPAVSGGVVYVDTGETAPMGSHLYAFDAATGVQICSQAMADYATSSVAVANGLAIVGSFSYQLYVFDALTCEKLWDSGFTVMQGGIASSPAVAGGAIVVGSNDKSVYSFVVTSGYPLGTVVSIGDSGFSPTDATGHDIGTSVEWTNHGTTNHTVTDSTGMGLFGSGTIKPGGTYTVPFTAACVYKYKDTLHTTLTGTVKAPVLVSPDSGTTSTTFTIQWATVPPAAGFVYDVQIKRPGATAFSNWIMGTSTMSSSFVPDKGTGTYSFKAHVKKSSSGSSCTYSSSVSISVS